MLKIIWQDHELYPQRVNRQKRLMDIEINFADGGSSRGGPGTLGFRRFVINLKRFFQLQLIFLLEIRV